MKTKSSVAIQDVILTKWKLTKNTIGWSYLSGKKNTHTYTQIIAVSIHLTCEKKVLAEQWIMLQHFICVFISKIPSNWIVIQYIVFLVFSWIYFLLITLNIGNEQHKKHIHSHTNTHKCNLDQDKAKKMVKYWIIINFDPIIMMMAMAANNNEIHPMYLYGIVPFLIAHFLRL